MPKPFLTIHVQERMESRGITKEQIFAALAREVRREPGEMGSYWVHGLVDGGRTLKVCLRVDNAR